MATSSRVINLMGSNEAGSAKHQDVQRFYSCGLFAATSRQRCKGAKRGYCLYKVGCKGPTTYNACSTIEWNGGLSWPVKSGHGCLGCAEDNFWDKGSFYSPVTNLGVTGNVEHTADTVGGVLAGAAAIGVAAHAVASGISKATGKKKVQVTEEANNG